MAKRDVVLTYKDYEALPADGRRYEIHDGELSVAPAPSPQHQMVSRNLFRILDGYVRVRGIGEVLYAPIDVILSDTSIVQPDIVYLDTAVQPDIVYLDTAQLGRISRRGIEGAPTLVVSRTHLAPLAALIERHGELERRTVEVRIPLQQLAELNRGFLGIAPRVQSVQAAFIVTSSRLISSRAPRILSKW